MYELINLLGAFCCGVAVCGLMATLLEKEYTISIILLFGAIVCFLGALNII